MYHPIQHGSQDCGDNIHDRDHHNYGWIWTVHLSGYLALVGVTRILKTIDEQKLGQSFNELYRKLVIIRNLWLSCEFFKWGKMFKSSIWHVVCLICINKSAKIITCVPFMKKLHKTSKLCESLILVGTLNYVHGVENTRLLQKVNSCVQHFRSVSILIKCQKSKTWKREKQRQWMLKHVGSINICIQEGWARSEMHNSFEFL